MAEKGKKVGSIARSIKRKKEKKQKKAADKAIREKMRVNSMLPEECKVCETPFDKSDKKMIDEWYMVVRNHPESVNLYCPTCWQSAIDKIEKAENENR